MFLSNLKNVKIMRILFSLLVVSVFFPMAMWSQTLGDVDSSNSVNIIDALLISQYYVGLNPANFQPAYADVDASNSINIIDALLISQYYVGLITEFPGQSQATPGPTQVPGANTQITLNGNSISVNGAGATVNGTIVTITSAGTYTINGSLNDGRIIVNTTDQVLVTLNLNGINVYSSVNSPLSIMNAPEGVEIVLGAGTVNTLRDNSNYQFDGTDDEPNATLFAKDDLDISGEGTLHVEANYNDGIACKDDMNIKDCTITVNAVDDGIRGKNSLEIKSGTTITVNSGGDCLKSDDEEDGLIEIKKCTLNLTSTGADGMDAEIAVTVTNEDANVKITTGGGSNIRPNDSVSTKGIKGSGSITIETGTVNINSSDDSIHSGGDITIIGGMLTLATGDDGVHSDTVLTIDNGTIIVNKSYEGLEAPTLNLNGGYTNVTADDDGINAASIGGTWPGTGGNAYLNIRGGKHVIHVTNTTITGSTGGDGLDCNGAIVMTGGTVLIHGQTTNVDSAIDYDGSMTISGGLIMGAGNSQMAMAPGGNSSSQNSLLYNFTSQPSGSLVNIRDTNGTNLITFLPDKNYSSIAFSSPNLQTGRQYIVYFGGNYSGGSQEDGLYQNGTYSPGTQGTTFTVSGPVTTIGGGGWIPF
ncbi:MAG: carbohydrate-binding domain-containing protein [Spirochaetales bacterium]|nr:carbohydrate-binding domain-containing protein [Spirochaetales bacterium]